jgi:hypothetical protein
MVFLGHPSPVFCPLKSDRLEPPTVRDSSSFYVAMCDCRLWPGMEMADEE